MRPVRIITAVALAAAVAVTGCAAHSTAADPSAAPAAPVAAAPVAAAPVAAAPASPAPKLPTPAPQPVAVSKQPTPAPKPPVLSDGRYDAFIRQVNTRGDYLVVDLVQVFEGQAAVDAAVADGQSRDTAQVLYTYIRNQNPRLRTLPLASDLRLDLHGGCEEPVSRQLAKLAADARAMSGPDHTYYFTLTVAGGAVHRVQEFVAINAC
jgi:hypothetical protein